MNNLKNNPTLQGLIDYISQITTEGDLLDELDYVKLKLIEIQGEV